MKNLEAFKKWEEANTDAYGKCIVDVARRVMEIIDKTNPIILNPDKLINQADDDIKAGGITGFMAGCAVQIVVTCHERGEEFRRIWNNENQIGTEGDKANETGGVLNPALLNIG